MPTPFDVQTDSPAGVEQILAAFGDEEYWRDRIAEFGGGATTLDRLDVDADGAVSVATTQDLPLCAPVVDLVRRGEVEWVQLDDDVDVVVPAPGPGPGNWAGAASAVAASPLAGTPPVLRLLGDLLYLDRYWLEEEQVCTDVLALVSARPDGDLPEVLRLFPDKYAEQRAAEDHVGGYADDAAASPPGTGPATVNRSPSGPVSSQYPSAPLP